MRGDRHESPSFLYGWLPRLVSFLLAVTTVLLVMAVPGAFVQDGTVRILPLAAVLWGMAAGFTHAVGFVPEHPLPRLLLGPGPAWLLLLGGLLWILVLWGPPPSATG
ncbi:MAG TPA: cyd operon YbgE family protein [Gammaproteobacteria bacterium]|nr:cyd operon YbgE family protein [Gammaproteobacteria bacterium]